MRRPVLVLLLLAGALAGVIGPPTPPAKAAWPGDPATNVPVCLDPAPQAYPVSVSDGQGGAIIAWIDHRNGNADIYAQRVDAAGHVLWATNGVPVCGSGTTQTLLRIASDGQGGALLCWRDDDPNTGDSNVLAQRLTPSGQRLWRADGAYLCGGAGCRLDRPAICSDGAGGAFLAFTVLNNSTSPDVACGRIAADGSRAWSPVFRYIGPDSYGYQDNVDIAPIPGGGAILAIEHRGLAGVLRTIYAQYMTYTGALGTAIALGTAGHPLPPDQQSPKVIPDGQPYGAIVTWCEPGGVFAQRVGVAPPSWGRLWSANGAAVCLVPGTKDRPLLVSDGAGGAIITWYDGRAATGDIFAQRLSSAGATMWSASGVPICTADASEYPSEIAPDGLGGAIIAWYDGRSVANGIYAQRVDGGGTTRWAYDGQPIQVRTGYAGWPTVVPSGQAGAIVSWNDYRTGNTDIYCQGVDQNGDLGGYEPEITNVLDVPNDQGGQVRLIWHASPLDPPPDLCIQSYKIWRRVAGAPAATAQQDGPGLSEVGGWEQVTMIPATGASEYACVVSTAADSMFEFFPYEVFRVEAVDQRTGDLYSSKPDSGYSVDNLAPRRPSPAAQTHGPHGVTLDWLQNREPDFRSYRLFRGITVDFTPSLANLIAEITATHYLDEVGTTGHHYKITAMDIHGNESPPSCFTDDMPTPVLLSLVAAEATTGRVRVVWRAEGRSLIVAAIYRRTEATEWQWVADLAAGATGEIVYEDFAIVGGERYGYRLGGTLDGEDFLAGEAWVEVPLAELALRGVLPNPARGPDALVRFALASDHPARLEVLDVSGRHVAKRDVGSLGPGLHAVKLANGAALAPGVYIVRLSQDGHVRLARAVVVR